MSASDEPYVRRPVRSLHRTGRRQAVQEHRAAMVGNDRDVVWRAPRCRFSCSLPRRGEPESCPLARNPSRCRSGVLITRLTSACQSARVSLWLDQPPQHPANPLDLDYHTPTEWEDNQRQQPHARAGAIPGEVQSEIDGRRYSPDPEEREHGLGQWQERADGGGDGDCEDECDWRRRGRGVNAIGAAALGFSTRWASSLSGA